MNMYQYVLTKYVLTNSVTEMKLINHSPTATLFYDLNLMDFSGQELYCIANSSVSTHD